MNNNQWLKRAQSQLEAKGIGSANIDAELILAHVLKKDRTYLLAHKEDNLAPELLNEANTLLGRRISNEPMAFLIGTKEFYGLPFKADARALIPRGESETLVTLAKDWLKDKAKPQRIAEIGTGSGAIIIALAQICTGHTYLATDISPEALDLAKENAAILGQREKAEGNKGQTGIKFIQGDLGKPLLDAGYAGKINVLVANLPYIPSDLLKTIDPTITYYEPNVALEGGTTGLELYEAFLPQAQQLLASNGLLLCEHDYYQSKAMRKLAKHYFPHARIETVKDFLGEERVLSCNLAHKM